MITSDKEHKNVNGEGWCTLSEWSFVKDVQEDILKIKNEINTLLQNHPLLVHKLGFGRDSWIMRELGKREMSAVVEEWIIRGGFHYDQIGYDSRKLGEWKTLPIFMSDRPQTISVAKSYFPFLYSIITKIPNVSFVGIFKQSCHGEITVHSHINDCRIFHFLLNDLHNGHCWIEVDRERRIMNEIGDCLAFDVRSPHSSGNSSQFDRTNLVIEVISKDD